MFSFICSDNQQHIIQFDFFFKTSFRGIILIEAKDMLESRCFNGNLYHVSKEYEFLDKFLYLKVLNTPYPEKYEWIRNVVKNSEQLKDIIDRMFGVSSYEELDKLVPLQIMSGSFFKNVFLNIKSCLQYIYYEIGNILHPQGISIAFTGPDGVGKTTIIEKITEQISNKHAEIKLFHHRPGIIGNISDVAKSMKLVRTVDERYEQPHRGKKKGIISSILRLCYYSADYVLGYWLKVRPVLFRRGFVLFDRYYTDLITDSRRSSIYLNMKFLYYWGKLFVPKMEYNILLTADTDSILERKQELKRQSIEEINAKMNYLSLKNRFYLIENSKTTDRAVYAILAIVFEAQHKKNLRRLGLL